MPPSEKRASSRISSELAETKKVILAGPPKVYDAEEGDDAIGEWDCPRQWFVEQDIHQSPCHSREYEGNSTHHQQRFLQSDVIIVVWVCTNTGYEWKRPLNKISGSSRCLFHTLTTG